MRRNSNLPGLKNVHASSLVTEVAQKRNALFYVHSCLGFGRNFNLHSNGKHDIFPLRRHRYCRETCVILLCSEYTGHEAFRDPLSVQQQKIKSVRLERSLSSGQPRYIFAHGSANRGLSRPITTRAVPNTIAALELAPRSVVATVGARPEETDTLVEGTTPCRSRNSSAI